MAYMLLNRLREVALAGTELANATVGTIRLKLLKIGAWIRARVRRARVAMASGCPYQHVFSRAHAAIDAHNRSGRTQLSRTQLVVLVTTSSDRHRSRCRGALNVGTVLASCAIQLFVESHVQTVVQCLHRCLAKAMFPQMRALLVVAAHPFVETGVELAPERAGVELILKLVRPKLWPDTVRPWCVPGVLDSRVRRV